MLEFWKTKDKLADIFTKPTTTKKFIKFKEMLGVMDFSRLKGSVKT